MAIIQARIGLFTGAAAPGSSSRLGGRREPIGGPAMAPPVSVARTTGRCVGRPAADRGRQASHAGRRRSARLQDRGAAWLRRSRWPQQGRWRGGADARSGARLDLGRLARCGGSPCQPRSGEFC